MYLWIYVGCSTVIVFVNAPSFLFVRVAFNGGLRAKAEAMIGCKWFLSTQWVNIRSWEWRGRIVFANFDEASRSSFDFVRSHVLRVMMSWHNRGKKKKRKYQGLPFSFLESRNQPSNWILWLKKRKKKKNSAREATIANHIWSSLVRIVRRFQERFRVC